MKEQQVKVRIKQCLELATLSSCTRRKIGAMIIDPERNVILMDGYNGPPRGPKKLCGGDCCLRDVQNIESGRDAQVGCHHAEMNAICNAAAAGISLKNSWMIVTTSCCMMCAKMIHHSGIEKVITIAESYSSTDGIDYLTENNVSVELILEKEIYKE